MGQRCTQRSHSVQQSAGHECIIGYKHCTRDSRCLRSGARPDKHLRCIGLVTMTVHPCPKTLKWRAWPQSWQGRVQGDVELRRAFDNFSHDFCQLGDERCEEDVYFFVEPLEVQSSSELTPPQWISTFIAHPQKREWSTRERRETRIMCTCQSKS